MRFSAFTIVASFGLAVATWPQLATAQNERDFVFTDEEGHLVLRYAGAQAGSLTARQKDEIINVSLSTMVHDRLRADIEFEAEPVDEQWTDSMTPRIHSHMRQTATEFSTMDIACRSATCRLVLEHANRLSIAEHQTMMGVVQRVIRTFVDTHPTSFDPVFLIAAYNQSRETPAIKVFLQRTAGRHQAGWKPAE